MQGWCYKHMLGKCIHIQGGETESKTTTQEHGHHETMKCILTLTQEISDNFDGAEYP